MFIIQNSYRIYGRALVIDMISSPGFDQDVRSVPKTWLNIAHETLKNRGSNIYGTKYTMSVEELATTWEDFDADIKGVYSEEWKSKEDEDDFVLEQFGEERETSGAFDLKTQKYADCITIRHLDGSRRVSPTFVIGYINNLLYRNRSNELSEYEHLHGVQNLISTGDSEDEEVIYESDMRSVFTEVDLDISDMYTVAQEMLFHMKRLYRFGGKKGIHMLSFIGAYLRAQHTLMRDKINSKVNKFDQKSVTRQLTSNAVIREGYWMAQVNGDPISKGPNGMATESAKNPRCVEMFNWMYNREPEYNSFHDDVDAIIQEANLLHVDLMKEDMLKYDAEFWNKVTVSFITPDSQFLKDLPLRLKTNAPMVKQYNLQQSYMTILRQYRDLVTSDSTLMDRRDQLSNPKIYQERQLALEQFFDGNPYDEGNCMYNAIEELKEQRGLPFFKVDVSKISFHNSLAYYEGKPLVLNCTSWYKYAGIRTDSIRTHYCILTNLFVFIELDTREFNYIYVDDAYTAFFYASKSHIAHDIYSGAEVNTLDDDLAETRKLWNTIDISDNE